ncbi:hypothetical protein GXM_08066 [Nostoc sphaeroides CCNUC1]|uniref:Uncharacterized protein n=1 Tax=Nostoc sphaeroides CCNUC1 TaxID=2653204 RepID=A0A5P8WDE1_9NOSO|nr:hypothetical protein GXM_08066 [Nostoc sphaeroides CCNUC1]
MSPDEIENLLNQLLDNNEASVEYLISTIGTYCLTQRTKYNDCIMPKNKYENSRYWDEYHRKLYEVVAQFQQWK